MAITIRRIRAHEADTLRDLRIAALTDTPSAFGSTLERELAFERTEWAARAAGSATGPHRATFFADLDRELSREPGVDVVAIVGGFRTNEAVELVSMWTAPSVRRRGVGRSLVDAVVDWARDADCDAVELWVTRGNGAAQGLYESAGFAVTGEHQALPSDPCVDEIRMRRPI